MQTLHTARLTAERPRDEHFDGLRELHADPRVMATLSPDGGIFREQQTQRILERFMRRWDVHGYGVWTFRDATNGRFVGYRGLQNTSVEGEREIELLYAIVSECWGRGLATEMAGTVLDMGFGRPGTTDVVAFTLLENRASRRVMEKSGFAYERDIVRAELPHVLYRRLTSGLREDHPKEEKE